MSKNKNNNLREPTPTSLKEPVVKIGSVVTLLAEITNLDFEKETWKLRVISNNDVREYISRGLDYCTFNSPLGLAIMGKTVGHSGEYKTDNGFPYRVTILDITNGY